MHDSGRYLKDGLTPLPTERASDISDLLPPRWMPICLCNLRLVTVSIRLVAQTSHDQSRRPSRTPKRTRTITLSTG
jgi:hypothetical protein